MHLLSKYTMRYFRGGIENIKKVNTNIINLEQVR